MSNATAKLLAYLALAAAAGCLDDPAGVRPETFLEVKADSVLAADAVSFTTVRVRLLGASASSYSKAITVATTAGHFLDASPNAAQVNRTPIQGAFDVRLIAPDSAADAEIAVSGEGLRVSTPIRFRAALPSTILVRTSTDTVHATGSGVVVTAVALRAPGEGVVSRNIRVELLVDRLDGTPLTELTRVQSFADQRQDAISFQVAPQPPGTLRFKVRFASRDSAVVSEGRTVTFVP